MRAIKCNTPRGQYLIPLKDVAENRANHYAIEVDGYTKDSQEYQNEVKYVMNDSYEGVDWLLNNSDWKDWENIAIKLNDVVKVDDEDFWRSSDNFEIIKVVL